MSQTNNSESTNKNFNVSFNAYAINNQIVVNNITGKWEGNLFFQYYYEFNSIKLWSNKYRYSNEQEYYISYNQKYNILSIRAIDTENNYKTVNIIVENSNVDNRPTSSISTSNKTGLITNTGFGGSAGQLNTNWSSDTNKMGEGNPNSAIEDFLLVLQYIKEYFDLGDAMTKNISIGSVFDNAYIRNEQKFSNMEKLFEYITPDVHIPYSTDVSNIHKIYDESKNHVNQFHLEITPKSNELLNVLEKESIEYKRFLLSDVYFSNILNSYDFFGKSKNLHDRLLTIFSKYAIS